MSWETFIVGNFELVDNISDEDKFKIMKELSGVLETEICWNERMKYYEFEDVNWSSHVDSEVVSSVINEHRNLFKYFEMSLLYLTQPHEEVILREDDDKADVLVL